MPVSQGVGMRPYGIAVPSRGTRINHARLRLDPLTLKTEYLITMTYNPKVGVVGLGYVGLPLAVEMARHFTTVGFDINQGRIATLRGGTDPNGEVDSDVLKASALTVTSNPAELGACEFVIVAVPTPVDSHNIPDLTPLVKASQSVGACMKPGTIVVYESTVYPGVTEDECVPVLEKHSGLKWKKDFFVGYSPERINPGDREHTFARIRKVVSGDTPDTLAKVAAVYARAVQAGVYEAKSIKVAEAAKVIENTQRDINIALMNELRIIFDKMGISTRDVLDAARTKWNFMPFEPGLVGGHCIGVDPYYLAYKAEELGHHPEVIMAGRRINDEMGKYFARQLVMKMIHRGIAINGARVLVLGFTFKENVPDVRNTRVIDIVRTLGDFGVVVDVHDPVADRDDMRDHYGVTPIDAPSAGAYDAVLLAVKHRAFLDAGREALARYAKSGIVFDLKEAMSEG